MSEQKESSVLFSLKELMSLEEDRIRGEEAEKAATTAAAERARAEAERIAREAEEARIRAEEERRRLDEQRSREENARLEAIRVAEIEKARVEAEGRARMEAMTAQQQHERSLAAVHNDESKKKLGKILLAIAIAVPVLGGGAGYFIYRNIQDSNAKIAAQEAEAARLAEEKEKLVAQMKAQEEKVTGLLSQLTSAKDEATRAALQKQLDEERTKQESLRKTIGGGGRPGAPAGAAPAGKKCDPSDPLCGSL
jgi:colicin import membrane protein